MHYQVLLLSIIGIFELQPIFPKYHMIWDVRKVLNYFIDLPAMSHLTYEELSHAKDQTKETRELYLPFKF